MDAQPVLRFGANVCMDVWHQLLVHGLLPSARVGHGCAVVNDTKKGEDKVFIFGGATPDGALADCYHLSLSPDEYLCKPISTGGFHARYEHAFVVSDDNRRIIVFGGANKEGNLSTVQFMDTDTGVWETLDPDEAGPYARTCHFSAKIAGRMLIFGGGCAGVEPVNDQALHEFDIDTCTWSAPCVSGEAPSIRQGHLMVAVGGSLFVHGGMNSGEMFDDLYRLETDTYVWRRLEPTGQLPCKRTASAGAAGHLCFYVFGGLSPEGPLNDLYRFETDSCCWSKLESSFAPAARLDHTLVKVRIPVGSYKNGSESDAEAPKKEEFLLLFGGMDTEGHIFNDCHVLRLR